MEKSDRTQKGDVAGGGGITVALSIAAFFIGGELLSVGRESVSESYSSGLAFLIALLFLPAAAGAAISVFGKGRREGGALKRTAAAVFGVLAAAAALFVAIKTAVDFSGFAADVMLLRAPRLPVALLFLAFCVFVAFKGSKAVRKFAFLSALAVGLCAIILLLISISSLDPNGVTLESGAIDVGHTVAAFVEKFAPVCVALVYFALDRTEGGIEISDSRGETKTPVDLKCGADPRGARLTPFIALSGVFIGGLVLAVCHFNVTMLLGSALSRSERFPYSAAIGAISAGKLFMRIEGLSYVMYFFSMSCRLSIAVGTLISLSKKYLPIKRRKESAFEE